MSTFKPIKSLALSLAAIGAGTTLAPASASAQDYYIGQIITVAFNFCPNGTARADGTLLAVSQNDALFSLYGTIYGGDGRTTFGLPRARGRSFVGQGSGPGLSSYREGQVFGAESTTMTFLTMPAHSHRVNANNLDGDKPGPGNKILAAAPDEGTGTETIYSDQPATVQMSSQMISNTGGSRSFPLRDPSLGLLQCVVLFGVYPSRN